MEGLTLAIDNHISEDKKQTGLKSNAVPMSMCLAAILLCAVKAHFFSHGLGEDTKSHCLTTGQSKMPSKVSPSTTTPPQCPKISRNDMVPLTRVEYRRLL